MIVPYGEEEEHCCKLQLDYLVITVRNALYGSFGDFNKTVLPYIAAT